MKALILSILFLSACGSSGGGGGSAAGNPLVGSWSQQFPNPANNMYLGVTGSSFTLQQGSCTISGNYSLNTPLLNAFNVTRSPSCISGPSSFQCSYIMPSNNQLDLNCPSVSGSFNRQ